MLNKFFQKLKYPKFLLLILTLIPAYILFNGRNFLLLHHALLSMGYFGAFLAGTLFVYGFTAAIATAILLILASEQNILLTGLIAGLGALAGDLLIFKFIRFTFADEIKKISREKAINFINNKISKTLKKYFFPILAGFIILSPLPDEIGVSLLAASTTISTKWFSILSYLLNTAGIFVILIIGTLI